MINNKVLVTGADGFIGSHVVRLFVNKYPDYRIINFDKLTYVVNLNNLRDIEGKPNYSFIKCDICDTALLKIIFSEEKTDGATIS